MQFCGKKYEFSFALITLTSFVASSISSFVSLCIIIAKYTQHDTLLHSKQEELTCTASANKSTPFNMAARPSTPNRISFPVAMPRRATLDRVDWMADWRRLREALFSVFMLFCRRLCYVIFNAGVDCRMVIYRRIDAGVMQNGRCSQMGEIKITAGLDFGSNFTEEKLIVNSNL